jgi:tetratricopeptide (TPR) repeat protein/AraC-like DNA-binding protein
MFVLPLKAQESDSASIFSKLNSADRHEQLKALKKIYVDYYGPDPIKGRPYVMKALELSRQLHDKAAEAEAFFALSFYYSTKGMADSGLFFCQIGMDLSNQLNSNYLLSRGYARWGNIERTKGEKAKAIEYLKKSIAMDSTNEDRVASSSMALGILYGDAACLEESVYYYLKALKIREAQNKLVEAGYLSCNLGGYYYDAPYGVYGIKAYQKAVDLFRRANFPKGESYAYNQMGRAYVENKDYRLALDCFRKSLAINNFDTTIQRSQIAFNLTNIGDTWLKLLRYDSAQYYYSKSLSLSLKDQDYIPTSCTYLSLGELNTVLKKYTAAIEFLKKGLYYSRLVNYRANLEDAYRLLSECYEAGGNQELALVYLKKRNEIRDSIVTEKAHQAIANMKIKYEAEKKDQQISILSLDSHNKQRKIRMAVFTILLILSLAGLLSYMTWLYYRKKLMPKVRTLNFIKNKISFEREGDNRRLRALEKVLPPELKPFPQTEPPEPKSNKDLIVLLEAMMLNDRIFLNENLTLAETASLLDSNTTYLSRLINEHYKVNFSAFLNRYRIGEAKRMILDEKCNNLSIEGIAKSSGFRSKSTFNQVFKTLTGQTPTEFALRNGKIRN